MPSNGFSLELPIGKVSKIKHHHGDSIYSIDELDGFAGTFAIARNKKQLNSLKTSDADVVYDKSKGKLYLNDNGSQKGWGTKKVGGLLAWFKGKPELSADNFEALSAHQINNFKVKKFKMPRPGNSKPTTIKSDTIYTLNSSETKLIETDQTSNTNLWKWDIGEKGIIYSQIRRYYDAEAKDHITEYVRSYIRGAFKYDENSGLIKSSQFHQEANLTLYRPDFSDSADWGGNYIGKDPVAGAIYKAPKSQQKPFKSKGALLDNTNWLENRYRFVSTQIHYRGTERPEQHTPGASIKDFRRFGEHDVFYSGYEESFLTDNFFD